MNYRSGFALWQLHKASKRCALVTGVFVAVLLFSHQAAAEEPVVVVASELPAVTEAMIVGSEPATNAADNTYLSTILARWLNGDSRAAQTALAQAAQEGKASWQAYLAVSVATARAGFANAIATLAPYAALPGARTELAELLLHSGIAMQSDDPERATATVRLGLRLAPDRRISVTEFSPDVVDFLQVAKTQQSAAVAVDLVVASDCEIAIDGGDPRATRAPGVQLQLEPGLHLLTARRAQGAPVSRVVEVAPKPQQQIQLDIKPDPIAAALILGARRDMSDSEANALLEAVHQAGDQSHVVVVAAGWERGVASIFAQRCNTTSKRCSLVASGPLDAKRLEPQTLRGAHVYQTTRSIVALTQQQPAALDSRPLLLLGPPTIAPKLSERCKWCRNRWLWLGAGASVVAASTTIWLLSRDRSTLPTVKVDPTGL